MNLKERAQHAASSSWGEETAADAEAAVKAVTEPAPAALVPIADVSTDTGEDPPPVTVHIAWARVMRDIYGIGKNSTFSGGGTRYNFRGVDAVINAFGPACRKHGVIVVPHRVTANHAPATSKAGNAMRETTTVVRWRIYGPTGDFIEGESEGESLDTGDKGTAKAQSVALRVFLIAAGLVPTDEKDPDAVHHERGERPMPKAADYVEEICNPKTSLRRLLTIKGEVERFNLGPHEVTNQEGGREPLGRLLWRIGKEREEEQAKLGGGA